MTPRERRLKILKQIEGQRLSLKELVQVLNEIDGVKPVVIAAQEQDVQEDFEEVAKPKKTKDGGPRMRGPKRNTLLEKILHAYQDEPPAKTAGDFWRSLAESLHTSPVLLRSRARNNGIEAKILR